MTRRGFFLFGLVTAWLGLAQPSWSQGTITYYQPATPIPLFTYGFPEQQALDFDGDSQAELTFSYSTVFLGVRSDQATRLLTWLSPPPNIGGDPAPLPFGFEIGDNSPSGGLQWFGDDVDIFERLIHCVDTGCGGAFVGQRAYMGIEFERAGATHYGWVLLNLAPHYPSGTIEAWAWDTRPGEAILAGAVPEPSTWALLVGGGVLMLWFRRKGKGRRG